jgi:hypothetical protein
LVFVLGDGHHRPLYQPTHVNLTTCQKLAQAAGHRGQHHVVDLGVVDVGGLFGEIQATSDDGQAAVGADRAVEAGLWSTLLGEDLPPGRQGWSRSAQGPGRMGDARRPATDFLPAPAQVVAQQGAGGRLRGRRPGRRGGGGRVGGEVQQRSEGGQRRGPVGEDVMEPQVGAEPPFR